ncbi:MAG: hypothetical protein M0R77_00530 [Gammaproteobacteria bacterium]|nr:hypothetical protein [Acholeplasmataceae bacterium]MCK9529040.1 hypothetical protein [Gammaproteobacteria bacterium]
MSKENKDSKTTGLTASMPTKALWPIGCLFDIPTGRYVKGRYNENILVGGLAHITGIVGHGNNFKSTIAHYMYGKMAARNKLAKGHIYDTELNVDEDRVISLHNAMEEYGIETDEMGMSVGEGIVDQDRLMFTDKSMHEGDEYFDILREFLFDKAENKATVTGNTPYLNRERNGFIKIPYPTFSLLDSFTEFSTKDVEKMQDDNSLGDSGANMIFMRQGMQKTRFLMTLPSLTMASSHYLIMTAHIGAEFNMDQYNPNPKKLQHLKSNVKIKGVPEKFTFLTHNCWWANGASILANRGTKGPEYPSDRFDNERTGSTDLNEVRVTQLRGKYGSSGFSLSIIVSQVEGVKPALSEFHYIKNSKGFGIGGNLQNYYLELYPDCKLSRTTVRNKLDSDVKLRRAVNITSEMCQMQYFWNMAPEYYCTPKELYDDIKALGYDWDVLLDTRGYSCMDHYEQGDKPLSTKDLLDMRLKRYVPFWLEDKDVPEAVKDVPRYDAFKDKKAK